MKSHAQVPTPLLCDGYIRVYFSSRPQHDLSLTSFVDIDIADPKKILRVNESPILENGKPGTFDEHGIMPSYALRDGSRVLLYYSGWSRGSSVPYTNSTGLAISEDGGETFKKISEGPILAKSIHNPYSATSPCVLREDANWHMWYCSGTGWLRVEGKYEHTYDIKHARSTDGIEWTESDRTTIAPTDKDQALTRPFATRRQDGYHMWFCYRGSRDFRDGEDAYKIGYASSDDMIQWNRDDNKAGMLPSPHGWDSKMVAYPGVIDVGAQTIMFYNGNSFGREGFGYATLEE